MRLMICFLKWPCSARLAGFAIPGRTAAPEQIPERDAKVQNRIFLRTAPNGVELVVRLLPGNTFEPARAYKTDRADYTQPGLLAERPHASNSSRRRAIRSRSHRGYLRPPRSIESGSVRMTSPSRA
jgi:hypothetical protein